MKIRVCLVLGLDLGSVLGLWLVFVIFRSKKFEDLHVCILPVASYSAVSSEGHCYLSIQIEIQKLTDQTILHLTCTTKTCCVSSMVQETHFTSK